VQLTVFTARESAGFFHRFINVLQQLADFLKEKLSFRRKPYATRAAAQKIDTDLILQVLNLSTQCWLRDSKAGSGFSEVQEFTNRQKVSQVSQFHRRNPLCRKSMAARQT
jgi:hypothetical protein